MIDWVREGRAKHAQNEMRKFKNWERQQQKNATRQRNLERMREEGVERHMEHANIAYDPDFCPVVHELIMDGKTHRFVAKHLGVSIATLYNWRKAYPEFAAAMSPVEEMTNEVEMSVFGKAKGYTYTAQRPMSVQGQIEIAEYEEHVAPDMTAAKMWLQAHAPQKWSDKSMVAHEVGGLRDILSAIGKEQSGLGALEAMSEPDAVEPPKSE